MPSSRPSRDTLTIYSMAACPYAQRTRILLHVKGIDSNLVEINLSKPRPEWFLKINPAGKVPTLVHRGRALNESSVINEYLEDCFPDVPLFPKEPYERALSRNLIEYCNGRFGMAELSYAPFFQRYWLNTYFWNFDVPPPLTRVLRWRDAVLSHDSVRTTSLSRDEYIKLYADYALGFANGKVPPGHARSSLDLSAPLSARPMPAPRFSLATDHE